MEKDSKTKINEIKVDGGMVKNNNFLQSLSNVTQIKIIRPKNIETTSLGAAYLAGLQYGIIKNTNKINSLWEKDKVSKSKISKNESRLNIKNWKTIIRTVNKFY